MNQGSRVLLQAMMQPNQSARAAILESLSFEHIPAGLALVEEMLRTATVHQRGALQDIVYRLLALRAEPELHGIFRQAQRDPDFPKRHLPWLSTILDLHLAQDEIEAFLALDESDTVLPLVFHLWEDNRWQLTFNDILKRSTQERTMLWSHYLEDVCRGRERVKAPYPLLELSNLDDPYVVDWLDENLEAGYYDANILAVCIEREDNRYFEPLWRAVWAKPKHKDLALRALTLTAPHVATPVTKLLERVTAETLPRRERQEMAHKLARSFSKVAFLRAQELCSSLKREHRIVGIEILEFFGSPWHNSRDACVQCLLSMLNDPEASVRARAVEAITSSERKTLAKLNPQELLESDQPSVEDPGWGTLVETLYYAADYKPLREDIWGKLPLEPHDTSVSKATYHAQELAPKSKGPQSSGAEVAYTPAPTEQTKPSRSKRVIFSSKQAYMAIVPSLLLIGVLMYGWMPRESTGVATVMSKPILKGASAVVGSAQLHSDVATESDRAARSRAELEGAMQIPHASIMLKRSKCWYLYHRLRPIDSAQYIATAPVPFGDNDPNWELYDTWLLDFIDREMANGVFDRVGEFMMTIAMVNPPLANQLVPKVLERATLLDIDSVAKSLVKGGAVDLEKPIVHPGLSELDASVIDELRDALLTGWKTDEDRILAKYLKDL